MVIDLSAAKSQRARGESADQAFLHAVGAAGGEERLASTIARFAAHLEVDGLHTALGYLNSRTRFRYTGAYRFAEPLLCSIEIYDRENPTLSLCAEVEMRTTYCSIVALRHEALAVDNAEHDARVDTHPAREQFAAYCGVPLLGPGARPFGTLCHYDPRPRIGSSEQITLLERVAPLVSAYSLARLS
jgi:GAF domain-containing protein